MHDGKTDDRLAPKGVSSPRLTVESAPVGAFPVQVLFRSCALFVGGIGLIAIGGWSLDQPVLASLGSDRIPVAPSTAAMFVLYAFSLYLRASLPISRKAHWTGLSINVAGALVAMGLFILSSRGVQLDAEHLGFAIVNKPGETPVGHMSPVTAICFLLSSWSYLLSLPSARERRWAGNLAWWLACGIMVIGATLILAYLYGEPVLYGTVFIPPAALTSLAFRAQPDNFDLLLTDMSMPRLNGDVLAREVLLLRSGMPIILCTGFSERIDAEKAKDLGIKEFLLKPVVKGELANAVRKALDGGSDVGNNFVRDLEIINVPFVFVVMPTCF